MEAQQLLSDNCCMRTRLVRSDGGASLAETALVIALVALVAAAVLSFVGSRSDASLDEAGKGIHHSPTGHGGGGSGSGSGTGAGGSGDTGGSGSTGGSGGGTTTPPAPSTTTTRPATTTTIAATTTTAPPAPATAALDDGRGTRSGSSRWNASADLQLAAEGAPTGSMSGTATVVVEWWRSNGQRSTQTIEVSIGADGSAELATGPYNRTGSSRINAVRYTVIEVDLDDGRGWDGGRPSIDIERPA